MADKYRVHITVNGVPYEREVEHRLLLVDFLREELLLTGTHVGCEVGECGACTVLYNGEAVRSCQMFAVQADGCEITTIEGLADHDGSLHPIQEAFAENFVPQCGYCMPGMVLSVHDLLRRIPEPGEDEIRVNLSGNICRCTGYQGVVNAVQAAISREVRR